MKVEEIAAQKDTLFLEPRHYESLLRILAEKVGGHRVWAFGSRATGRYRWKYSDLDLAIEGAMTSTERNGLTDALENSLLPVRVDVVELAKVDRDFAERIGRDFVLVQNPCTSCHQRAGIASIEQAANEP